MKKKSKGFEALRDVAILRVFLDTGARLGGIASMRVDELDTHKREAWVQMKNATPLRVVYGHKAAKELDRYTDAREIHPYHHLPYLWISRFGRLTDNGIGQMIRKGCVEAGIDHINPHLFRHTFAHQMKMEGRSEEDIMQWAGWTSRQMLLRYGAGASQERARDAYRSQESPGDRLRV